MLITSDKQVVQCTLLGCHNKMDRLLSFLPNICLRKPWWLEDLPLWMKVFYGVMFFYFFILSGIIYDIVEQPPFLTRINENGSTEYSANNRVHSQFISEGLIFSYLIVQGSLGFMLLDHIHTSTWSKKRRNSFIIGALYCILLAFGIMTAGCYEKSENYLTFRFYGDYKWPLLEYKKFEGF